MKKILAITCPNQEYMYKIRSAHAVTANQTSIICNALNRSGYKLAPGEIWRTYTVGKTDAAYDISMFQRFTIRSGRLQEVIL